MMPQWAYMHIAGQDASEYLSPGLVQFARATDTYFSMGNKFRNPTVAPTHDVTTDRSQRLMLRFVPVDREDNTYSYKVRYTLAVGDNRVLDMASTFFDIRGVLDRGPSFKPYSGTAYNSLAPKGAPNTSQWIVTTGEDNATTYTFGIASTKGDNITKEGLEIGKDITADNKPIYADKTYQPEPQVGEESWTDIDGTNEKFGGRALKPATKMKPCYGSFARPTNIKGGQAKNRKVTPTEGDVEAEEPDIDMEFLMVEKLLTLFRLKLCFTRKMSIWKLQTAMWYTSQELLMVTLMQIWVNKPCLTDPITLASGITL